MKNSRIIKAYDSINPSASQKQKMLDAILQEAGQEETPRKRRKEPAYYTARPTKTSKRSMVGTIAASLVLLTISGLILAHMMKGREPAPSFADPTQEVQVTRNPYEAVLQNYETAIEEGWTKEQCQLEGISTRFYMPEPIEYTVGYQILDINGDGRDEFIVGHDSIIWDLYTTLEDGTPIQLLSDEQEGWQYYLNERGLIAAEYFSKEDCYVEYYRLEGHQLVMELQLQYSDGQWMQQKAGQEWEPIIEDAAQSTMNSFERLSLDWIPLTPVIDVDALEHYMLTLEKYKTAVLEKWNPGQCMENGISLMVGYYGDFVTELGYTMMDLDGNGVQELIITDGTNIYDLYTMVDNTPVQVLSAMERIQYFLTEDNMIYHSGSGGAGMHVYSLSSLEERNLRVITGFMYAPDTDPSNPWFYYDGEDQGDPCGFDAQPIIDNWKVQHIPFTSFE